MNYVCIERYNIETKEKSYILCKSENGISDLQRNDYIQRLDDKKDVFHKTLFVVDENRMNDIINFNTVTDLDMEMIVGNLPKKDHYIPIVIPLKDGEAF